jgi:hypothetical protein
LKIKHEWSGTDADQLALLFIYIPIIRQQVFQFANLWNVHSIRRQRQRPNLPHGKPYVLYHHPPSSIMDYSCLPDAELLNKLRIEVDKYSLDEYLPASTMTWCSDLLIKAGYKLPLRAETANDEGIRMHKLAYRCLRTAIQQHIDSNASPKLSFVAKPTSALTWRPPVTDNVSELELSHDGPDEELKEDHIPVSEDEDLTSYL